MQTPESLRTILDAHNIPLESHVVWAFGYGSGVLPQQQQQQQHDPNHKQQLDDVPVVDFILVVDDAQAFHQANLQVNPSHYWIRNASFCSALQTHRLPIGWWWHNPGLYFNVTDTIKYGVVTQTDLLNDLNHWTSLYCAGRLHKPVVMVIDHNDDKDYSEFHSLTNAQQQVNLPAALATALLLQDNNNNNNQKDESSSLSHLFETIASLSYQGDPRVKFAAEDPNKVAKLVHSKGQLQRFTQLYQPIMTTFMKRGLLNGDGTWDNSNATARRALAKYVPFLLLNNNNNDSIVLQPTALRQQLATIVGRASTYQSAKGLVTAGPVQSTRYLFRKLSKGWLRK